MNAALPVRVLLSLFFFSFRKEFILMWTVFHGYVGKKWLLCCGLLVVRKSFEVLVDEGSSQKFNGSAGDIYGSNRK